MRVGRPLSAGRYLALLSTFLAPAELRFSVWGLWVKVKVVKALGFKVGM